MTLLLLAKSGKSRLRCALKCCLWTGFFWLMGMFGPGHHSLHAQTSKDSTEDSLRTSKASPKDTAISKLDIHHRRMLKSAVLPGWGQIENGQAWKTGVIYAGFAALAYSAAFAHRNYVDFREAYRKRTDGDSTTVDQFADRFARAQTLRETREFYRRNRDLSYIGMGLLYIANLVDAFVYSHLTTFDVSDDLSLQVVPSGKPLLGRTQASPGRIKIEYRF